MNAPLSLWIIFWITFVSVSAIDLFVVTHRKDSINVATALKWTGLWIGVALGFGVLTYFIHPGGAEVATLFVAGYLTEYSLSVDNLFVFILIFSLMGVREAAQPKLIKLGIYLSIVLRIGFILFGIALVQRFHWLLYVFGALLIWTAWKMLVTAEEDSIRPESNFLYRLASRFLPMHTVEPGSRRLAIRVEGRWYMTPLFLVFLVIGSTDLLFALDSIPAIMGISQDPFVVLTSNIFAVLGLNSLFFAIRGVMSLFRYLKHGVSFILFFIGLKMIVPGLGHLLTWAGLSATGHLCVASEEYLKQHTWISLAVIGAFLAGAMLLSLLTREKLNTPDPS